MQLDFFQTEAAAAAQKITGLLLFPNFISQERAANLVKFIDSQSWQPEGKRRVQHYGYAYEPKGRSVTPDMYLGELPEPFQVLADKFHRMKFTKHLPDQVIVNEYQPGQGLSGHVDCESCFEDEIVTVSLLSDVVMNWDELATKKRVPLLVAPRSVLVCRGKSRYKWKHAIPSRKTDAFAGAKLTRERRISLTFRKVIVSEPKEEE